MNTTIERLKYRKYVAAAGFNVYESRTAGYVIRIHRIPNAGPGIFDWEMHIYRIPDFLPDILTGEEIDLGFRGYASTKRELSARAQRFVAGDDRWWMGEDD